MIWMLLDTAKSAEETGTFDGFDWGIHAITIPAVLLLGVAIGWSMAERKRAQDEARKEIQRQKAG